jgi:hypothetical protein
MPARAKEPICRMTSVKTLFVFVIDTVELTID